jgi:hypothetical protein
LALLLVSKLGRDLIKTYSEQVEIAECLKKQVLMVPVDEGN